LWFENSKEGPSAIEKRGGGASRPPNKKQLLTKNVLNMSQIELNRPMKGVSFRWVNHAELELPP
jgi:hypothetical protein